MGTNYYRIPTASEMERRRDLLQTRIRTMEMTPGNIERNMAYMENPKDQWSYLNPWDEFIADANVHLGKRSGGWKFCWNFHEDKYYKDKAMLEAFIRSGRVVDEYGTEIEVEEFIKMAMEWGQPDGWDTQSYYVDNPSHRISWMDPSKYEDRYVDGLRISSSTEFS
jgi:hypothetical protein